MTEKGDFLQGLKGFTAEIIKKINKPNRVMAPFWWFGGKGMLASKLIPLLPQGEIYVEAFCGAASMFWHLPKPYPCEVLNDLNEEIVTLFRVLQDKKMFDELAHKLAWTPYSCAEMKKAFKSKAKDPVGKAWAFFVNQSQSFGGTGDGTWGRVFGSQKGMASAAYRWRSRLRGLEFWHDRLMCAQIENRSAIETIKYWDSEDTVFYLDPPYVKETRKLSGKKLSVSYDHECSNEFHKELVELLLTIKGQAMLSGYAHEMYKPLEEAGWLRTDFQTACNVAGRTRQSKLQGKGSVLKHVPRVETVWVKRDNTRQKQKEMF